MGFFSKSADQKAAAPDAATPAAKKEEGGMFCGMNLVDFCLAIVIFGLFFFFIIWPLLYVYFMLLCLWIVMWPFVKFVPCCRDHKYVGPTFRVVNVVVTSPIKIVKTIYHMYHKDDDDDDDKNPTTSSVTAAAAAAAAEAMTKV